MGLVCRGIWGEGLTIRVELEDVQVAVCVGNDDEKLFAIGEEICGDGFDVLQGFAELAELVGFLLRCELAIRFELFSFELSKRGRRLAYAIAHKRHALDRIPHHAQPRPFQLFRTADIALHVHKCDG